MSKIARAPAAALLALLAGSLAAQAQAEAETERLQPDFTFRRVGVPVAEVGSRITVQIDPAAPSAIRPPDAAFASADPDADAAGPLLAAAPAMTGDARGAAGAFDWYWQTVSPAIAASGPGRLQTALAGLRLGEVPAPRLQTLQNIAAVHGREIMMQTIGTGVSPALVLAVISVESAGRIEAVSSAGAVGLMQLMPATAERFGVTERGDAAQSIGGGVAYLDWLLGHFDGDPVLALAGYNAGEGAVRQNGGVPPYAETRGYVPKVLAAFEVARGLCLTPPVLISDGCVFKIGTL